ncbi:MAG TPA: type III pantothenate kinase [Candidatus Cloacimonetes bacterium]|nr:type III pantothenate kinase [Candidatus Cloacimonadota bacterium]
MENCYFVIDIGNTHIVMGVYQQNKLIHSWRFGTDNFRTEDEYFAMIKLLFLEKSFDLHNIKKIALASVVPELTHVYSHLIKKYLKCPLIKVDAYSNLGLNFPMKDPGFIGADLIVNAFAAREFYQTNCIICDFGTATTIQLIGKDGHFYGTVISPGVITSSSNLIKKASLLSDIRLVSPKNILGTTTKDALLSGILTGNALMIDGFIREIRSAYKKLGEIKAIATGGISDLICKNSKEIDIIDKELTLNGLNYICRIL